MQHLSKKSRTLALIFYCGHPKEILLHLNKQQPMFCLMLDWILTKSLMLFTCLLLWSRYPLLIWLIKCHQNYRLLLSYHWRWEKQMCRINSCCGPSICCQPYVALYLGHRLKHHHLKKQQVLSLSWTECLLQWLLLGLLKIFKCFIRSPL